MGVLNCQCRTVQMAATVRSTFASLIKSEHPPTYLGKISISFSHQIGTRVRLSLLKSISRRQKEKEPNAVCSVSAFSARPLLRVGSVKDGKDQGTRFLSYVDAIHGFRHLLKQEDLDRALSMCTGLRGHLRSRFLVLSDDRVLPPAPAQRGKRAHPDKLDPGVGKRKNTSAPPPTTFSTIPSTSFGFRPPSAFVTSQTGFSAPVLNPGVSDLSSIVSVHSPGVQFPPLTLPGVRPIVGQPLSVSAAVPVVSQPGDGFQKVKQRRSRKKKGEAPSAEATKVPTPSRTAPPRQVRTNKSIAMEVLSQDESDGGSESSEGDYVDAPHQDDI